MLGRLARAEVAETVNIAKALNHQIPSIIRCGSPMFATSMGNIEICRASTQVRWYLPGDSTDGEAAPTPSTVYTSNVAAHNAQQTTRSSNQKKTNLSMISRTVVIHRASVVILRALAGVGKTMEIPVLKDSATADEVAV